MNSDRPRKLPWPIKLVMLIALFAAVIPGAIGLFVIAAMMPYAPDPPPTGFYVQYIAKFLVAPLALTVMLILLAKNLVGLGKAWAAAAILMLPLLAAPYLFRMALQ